jgi:hypothetical protein
MLTLLFFFGLVFKRLTCFIMVAVRIEGFLFPLRGNFLVLVQRPTVRYGES